MMDYILVTGLCMFLYQYKPTTDTAACECSCFFLSLISTNGPPFEV